MEGMAELFVELRRFGTEIGYEIKHGKLGRMLKNCSYTGTTPEFWRSCDAVCDERHWVMYGTPNCGKGQPTQIAHTGPGALPSCEGRRA